ncbi:uncharacterized protein LOC122251828 [Penaeus japonicus]|uniref:uncharacterized protein LOC122251828 n=1 Tax=Penaeus japonicus TaxID=27405 RepID=UPI001C7159D0|nr:uncharacterized protein LOC122251828 [Penaeus japonicus]XP_042869941.1 uncharacterized protein LOC122251828 [Penaeus japonicus]XP_042869942.1 uncharacterized protein LOC122251828 [Penaeus japonicus]XP_042869943.1 uncharacterized protein LOC122251828 [Penaeus japonicus]XP_042869945.1 uncharacterized protein LOC122251828 [Penaeus japonicus]
MEVETTKKSYNWDWIKINLKFMTEVIQQAGNLPLDSACTAQELFLTAVDRTGNPKKHFATNEKVQCQKCSTPWIAGYFMPRLRSAPRSAKKVRALLKKQKNGNGKLNRHENRLISAFYARKNILEMKCLVCRDKHIEMFKVPYKRVVVSEPIKEPEPVRATEEKKKKNKKKMKKKEVNAGLRLPVQKVDDPQPSDDKESEHELAESQNGEDMEMVNGNSREDPRYENAETENPIIENASVEMEEDLENKTDSQSESPEDILSKRITESLEKIQTTLAKPVGSKASATKSHKDKTIKPAKTGKQTKPNSETRKPNKLNAKVPSIESKIPAKTNLPLMKNQRPKNLAKKKVNIPVRVNPIAQSKKEVQAKLAGLKTAVLKDKLKNGNNLGSFLKSLF